MVEFRIGGWTVVRFAYRVQGSFNILGLRTLAFRTYADGLYLTDKSASMAPTKTTKTRKEPAKGTFPASPSGGLGSLSRSIGEGGQGQGREEGRTCRHELAHRAQSALLRLVPPPQDPPPRP